MATVRSIQNPNQLIDWSEEVNEIENQYGYINSQNYFQNTNISQNSVVFDKNTHDITLLPQVARGSRHSTVGKDRNVETFSLPLAYFKHFDAIMPEDIQGIRAPGDSDNAETLSRVRVEKLTDMRLAADQTLEYIQLKALKGAMVTPDGATVADMFSEFNITQTTIDLQLGSASTDVDAKIREVKKAISTGIKQGSPITGVDVFLSPEMFNALVAHPSIREAYLHYQNAGTQNLRDDLQRYTQFGITDHFTHRGVNFMTYDAVFNLPNGVVENAFQANEGLAIPVGGRGLFRSYFGPSHKLSGANESGQRLFAYEYTDPKDECHELELEMAPLFMCTKPQALIKLTTS